MKRAFLLPMGVIDIVDHFSARPQAASAVAIPPALQRAMIAARTAEENRGRDIVILDFRELSQVYDFFVLATGSSRQQLHAMSEEIDHALEEGLGDRRLGIEGYNESRWILLDYGDVVVHLFDDETRRYYAIEDLWAQARRVPYTPLHEAQARAAGG